MTLSKLAKLANVSISVVSKAFAGKSGVSEEMREHVFSVARKYGCFQQFYHARYDKPVIAVIIPEVISKYYIKPIEIFKKNIEENGYTMLLSISNFDSRLTEDLVRYYSEHIKVDGILLVGSQFDFSFNCETDLISVITSKSIEACDCVGLSFENGIRKCLEYLLQNGHRRVAYIGEPLTDGREKVIISEMQRIGLPVNPDFFIVSQQRFENAGKDGTARLMNLQGDKPTAIIGAYGYIAEGIISRLSEMGLSVPEDMSVISMDSDPFPIHPTIDVAHIPSETEHLCAQALKLLHERIKNESAAPDAYVEVSTSFYKGNSIKKV